MEQYINIPTSDGLEIRWILNQKQETNALIIFVHGFTWSTNEAHYVGARDYFTDLWFATYRFSLYHSSDSCRKLHTSTIAHHSYDVQQVIHYFSPRYDHIVVVWHSLWWPSIIGISDFKPIDKIIFWDPALEMQSSAKKAFKKNDIYFTLGGSGKNIEVWKDMLEEFSNIDYFEKLKNIEFDRKNIWIIYASEDRHVLFKSQTDELWIKSYTMEWSDHCFTKQWDLQKLYNKTLEFIDER